MDDTQSRTIRELACVEMWRRSLSWLVAVGGFVRAPVLVMGLPAYFGVPFLSEDAWVSR